jgi:hypothetical protein
MPKRIRAPTTSRHFQFFSEDLDFLEKYYGPRSSQGLSMNEIVRSLVHNGVKAARARLVEKAEQEELRKRFDGEGTERKTEGMAVETKGMAGEG